MADRKLASYITGDFVQESGRDMPTPPDRRNDLIDDGSPNEISRRFSSSESVTQSLASLTSLLDHLPAMIAYWDTELRNRFANHAYIDWFGIDPVQLSGMHIRDLLGEKVFELNVPFMRRALAGEQQNFERTLIDPQGRTRYSQATYTPHIVDGRTEGFFVLVSDVSELKLAQTELTQRNDELATAVRAREMLMATVTHDLRSPLSSIIGYTELLAEGPQSLSAEEFTSYLEVISRNSRELLSLVNQLVELGHIESGTEQFTLEPVDAVAAATAIVSSLQPAAHATGLVTIDIEPAEPLFIQTDIHALNRVLTNLATNAIKFTPAGRVTLRVAAADGRGQIHVIDSGPGISPEDQQVIFNAFERGTSNTKSRVDGIGLGLHICEQLTSLTHGDIGVRSEVGKGSTFTVSWPLAPAFDRD